MPHVKGIVTSISEMHQVTFGVSKEKTCTIIIKTVGAKTYSVAIDCFGVNCSRVKKLMVGEAVIVHFNISSFFDSYRKKFISYVTAEKITKCDVNNGITEYKNSKRNRVKPLEQGSFKGSELNKLVKRRIKFSEMEDEEKV